MNIETQSYRKTILNLVIFKSYNLPKLIYRCESYLIYLGQEKGAY